MATLPKLTISQESALNLEKLECVSWCANNPDACTLVHNNVCRGINITSSTCETHCAKPENDCDKGRESYCADTYDGEFYFVKLGTATPSASAYIEDDDYAIYIIVNGIKFMLFSWDIEFAMHIMSDRYPAVVCLTQTSFHLENGKLSNQVRTSAPKKYWTYDSKSDLIGLNKTIDNGTLTFKRKSTFTETWIGKPFTVYKVNGWYSLNQQSEEVYALITKVYENYSTKLIPKSSFSSDIAIKDSYGFTHGRLPTRKRLSPTAALEHPNECGCYLGADFYTTYFADLQKQMKGVPIPTQKHCYYPKCANAHWKPHQMPDCANIVNCIQNVDVDVGGNVTGKININPTADCRQYITEGGVIGCNDACKIKTSNGACTFCPLGQRPDNTSAKTCVTCDSSDPLQLLQLQDVLHY